MALGDEVIDSPTGWVAKHIKEYVESDGARGHDWKGVPTLLLTTRGRKTGARRRTALIYGRDGDSYVVVASIGGAPKHPQWYLNLEADPTVELQVGPEVMTGRGTDRRPCRQSPAVARDGKNLARVRPLSEEDRSPDSGGNHRP